MVSSAIELFLHPIPALPGPVASEGMPWSPGDGARWPWSRWSLSAPLETAAGREAWTYDKLFFFFFFKFIYFEREREHGQGRGRERERERERESQADSCTIHTEPDMGLKLSGHEITT